MQQSWSGFSSFVVSASTSQLSSERPEVGLGGDHHLKCPVQIVRINFVRQEKRFGCRLPAVCGVKRLQSDYLCLNIDVCWLDTFSICQAFLFRSNLAADTNVVVALSFEHSNVEKVFA